MGSRDQPSERVVITLRENGLHSLWRGIVALESADRSKDKFEFKDAIMFLHHGVELLMKEILVRHSPFLKFADLESATNKQREADQKGIGIFFLEKPPKTVTYVGAIDRVRAFVKPTDLTHSLYKDLQDLNQLRNQVEHYAIEIDEKEIIRLLAELKGPLLDLFESQLGGVKDSQPIKVRKAWKEVEKLADKYAALEQEVADLMRLFRGQKVPGRLLGREGEISLPAFDLVSPSHTRAGSSRLRFDVLAEGPGDTWAVEIKAKLQKSSRAIEQMIRFGQISGATPWLIVFDELSPRWLEEANAHDVLITGKSEWTELKRLVQAEDSSPPP